mgnify:CR=1 FL=1
MKRFFWLASVIIITLIYCSCSDKSGGVTEKDGSKVYSCVTDYLDSLDAVITSDGYLALYGISETVLPDNSGILRSKCVYLNTIDLKKGTVNNDEAVLVLLDSQNSPVSITAGDYSFTIVNNNGKTFDLIGFENDGDPWLKTGVSLSDNGSSRSITPSRGDVNVAMAEPVPFLGFAEVFDAIAETENMYDAIVRVTGIAKSFIGFSVFADLKNNEGWKEGVVSGASSESLISSLKSLYLSQTAFMWTGNRKFINRYLGDCRIAINSVAQKESGSVVVNYEVSGLNANAEGAAEAEIVCQNLTTGKRLTVPVGSVVNGLYEYPVSGLDAGKYGFEMRLYDKCHAAVNLSVLTYPQVNATIYSLGIDSVKVNGEPEYLNGKVTYHLDIYLDGKQNGLASLKEWGYFIRNGESIQYHNLKNEQDVFNSIPLSCNLAIDRNDFIRDYNTFTAVADGCSVGVYYVTKKDNATTAFDEMKIDGLVYNVTPDVIFRDVQLFGTNIIDTDPDWGNRYMTEYEFKCDIKGSFWYDRIQFQLGGGWSSDWEAFEVEQDLSYVKFNAYITYPGGTDLEHFEYFIMYLTNGDEIASSNALICEGTSDNLSYRIDELPALALMKKSKVKVAFGKNMMGGQLLR